jgi:hypothetical protein
VIPYLKNGYLDLAEDKVQRAIEQIIGEGFHQTDWAGELNDLYSNYIVFGGNRIRTAFFLKGNGLRKYELKIKDCGDSGYQIVRLFNSPAELFIVQFVGNISQAVITHVESMAEARSKNGKKAWYSIISGQDTARLLVAYNKLDKNDIDMTPVVDAKKAPTKRTNTK